MALCEGCGKELGVLEALYWAVCMDCTKARHRAFCKGGRCTCGRKRREREVANGTSKYARRWIACDRCLGSVRQLN